MGFGNFVTSVKLSENKLVFNRSRTAMAGVTPQFNPLFLPGLKVWLEAENGLTSSVSWADRTGNVTLVPVSTYVAPTRIAGGLNGKAYANFGVGNCYIRGTLTSTINSPCMYGVIYWADTQAGVAELSTSDTLGNSHTMLFNDAGYFASSYLFRANPVTDGFANRVELTGTYNTTFKWQVFAFYSTSKTQFRAKVWEGSRYTTDLVSPTYSTWTRNATHIGMGSLIAAPTSYFFGGSVAELVIYSGSHTEIESNLVINYLRFKYAL
jgi:hypothetical protein